jgi:hypothetical protein
MQMINECGDKNVCDVVRKHVERAGHGLNKYGVTTERTDLTRAQWLQHLQDELMDGAIYLQRLLKDDAQAQLAVEREREAICMYIESVGRGIWGKNLAETIRKCGHLRK